MRPAVFLDRDGTLIEEVNYLSRLEDLRSFAYTKTAVQMLKNAGFSVIVVTNQSGVGRGIFEESAVTLINDEINAHVGGIIDAFYYCPHLPCDGCICRKPQTGMLQSACEDLEIDLSRSWMVGDKAIDIETGLNAGLRTALVLTGYGRSHVDQLQISPDIIATDLEAAALEIVRLSKMDLERG